jgi:Kef-type K+ transport system membrane component KefB
MAEPATSGVAGVAGWKLIGGAAGIAAGGMTLSAFVVMLMTWPKTFREIAVALISTALSSCTLGAATILYFDLLRFVVSGPKEQVYVALVALLGLVFFCGLPGWLLVRSAFKWMEKRKDKDFGELIGDVRRDFTGGAQ